MSGHLRRVYSFAEAVDADGRALARGDKPLAWGGNVMLCTRAAKFELSEHKDCGIRGLAVSGFVAVDIAVSGPTTVRLTE